MPRRVALIAMLIAIVFTARCRKETEQANRASAISTPHNKKIIGIIEPMQHIAVSDITRGIRDGLQSNPDVTIVVRNANGDATAVPQVIANLRDSHADVVVPIFTGTTQAAKDAIRDRPVIFAAVTDPVAAKLLSNPKSPEGNVTGVSDLWPIGDELDLIRTIVPSAKRIGILYDPNDPSSSATMPLISAEATKRGMKVVSRPVHEVHEITDSLAALKGSVDLLFTANDVTVTKSFGALVSFAITNHIPLFAGDYSSVERGAIAAVGQNYHSVGLETAKLINRVLAGEQVSHLPVAYTSGGEVYLNRAAAAQMGVTIPASVAARATKSYDHIATGVAAK